MQKVGPCKRWEHAKGGTVQKVGPCKRWERAKGGNVQKGLQFPFNI